MPHPKALADKLLSMIERKEITTYCQLEDVLTGIVLALKLKKRQGQTIWKQVMKNEEISVMIAGVEEFDDRHGQMRLFKERERAA